MKALILGYENGYLVNGQFQSNCPMSGEYQPVKVRVSIERGQVVREYQERGKRQFVRIVNHQNA